MTSNPILVAETITKRFGKIAAISEVSFDVLPGEVHALCGENGAGKSTLMKVLSGQYPFGSYEGKVRIAGKVARFQNVRDSERSGIAIVHQELSLIGSLSVTENILLGKFPRNCWRINWPASLADVKKILSQFQVPIRPETLVADLGIGHQQLVEIARALSKNPRILILDEPTAALTQQEIDTLLNEVRRLCGKNVACIYISHKLEEVKEIADRITVLRDGNSVSTKMAVDFPIEEIIHDMVGREIEDIYPHRKRPKLGEVLLNVVKLDVGGVADHHSIEGVNLSVRAGEIVGIGGLMGSGRSELLLHLFGIWGHCIAGQVTIRGVPYDRRTPALSIGQGMMLVTEDRKRFGLIPDESINRNLSLSSLSRYLPFSVIDRIAEQKQNKRILAKLQFRALSTELNVRQLSGGNQQKVVLGRGLLTEPHIVLLDEPTRGVDVGARREIYEEIARLANEGKAIVVVSSEMSELIGICDRIIIMHEGKITASFNSEQFDQDLLMAAALGKN